MSDKPPTEPSDAPSQPESSAQESPWQAALKYFNTATSAKEATSQNPPSAGGPFSRLQSALGYLADRALVQTSITIESSSDATASSSATANGREEPSPIAKTLDYVSLSVFAPEMIRSSSSSSSIGVTIVRPLSRSCLREVHSAPNFVASVPGVTPNNQQRRPLGPRASVPTVRSRYRFRLIPSLTRQPEPPRPTQSETSATTVTTLPSSQSSQYYYACNASGQPSSYYVLLPSGASSCRQEHSCCSECRCGYRYPDPLEIFRTFSAQMNSYRNFGFQNPFGMSSVLPYWPLPQHPYYYYPPGSIVPFQTWLSSRSSYSGSSGGSGQGQCEQCAWETRQKRASPPKAVRDFSTLVQAAPSGVQPLRMMNKMRRNRAKFGQPVTASAADVQAVRTENKDAAQEAQGPDVSKKTFEFLAKSIENDQSQTTAAPPIPSDSLAVQQTTEDKEKVEPQVPAGTASGVVEPSDAAFDAPKPLLTSGVQPSLIVEGQNLASVGSSATTAQAPGTTVVDQSTTATNEPRTATASTVQPSLRVESEDQASPGLSDTTAPPASLARTRQAPGILEPQVGIVGPGSPQQASDNLPFVNSTEQKPEAPEADQVGAGESPIQSAAAPSVQGLLPAQLPLPQQPPDIQPTPINVMPEASSPQSSEMQPSFPQQPAEPQPTSQQNESNQPPVLNSIPQTTLLPSGPQPREGTDTAPVPADAVQGAAGGEDEGWQPHESAPTAATMGALTDDEDTESMAEKGFAIEVERHTGETVSNHSQPTDEISVHLDQPDIVQVSSPELPDSPKDENPAPEPVADASPSAQGDPSPEQAGPKPEEQAIDIELAADDDNKPDENPAHIEQNQDKPAIEGGTVQGTPNNFNGAMIGCAAITLIFIITLIIYSLASASYEMPASIVTEAQTSQAAALMFEIEHYNHSHIVADEDEPTEISLLDL